MDRAAGSKSLSLGTPLLRFGVAKKWELRVAGDGFVSQRGGGASLRGLGDIEFGFKYKFPTNRSGSHSGVSASSACHRAQAFTSGTFDPGFKLTW
jgi:hypothetical protein